jgi:hypothetical protein
MAINSPKESNGSQGNVNIPELMSFIKEHRLNTGGFFRNIDRDLATKGDDVTLNLKKILNLKPDATTEKIEEAIKWAIVKSGLKK